jgi:hypothetical protein
MTMNHGGHRGHGGEDPTVYGLASVTSVSSVVTFR